MFRTDISQHLLTFLSDTSIQHHEEFACRSEPLAEYILSEIVSPDNYYSTHIRSSGGIVLILSSELHISSPVHHISPFKSLSLFCHFVRVPTTTRGDDSSALEHILLTVILHQPLRISGSNLIPPFCACFSKAGIPMHHTPFL
jgi:hypothetical protein